MQVTIQSMTELSRLLNEALMDVQNLGAENQRLKAQIELMQQEREEVMAPLPEGVNRNGSAK